MLIFTWSIPFFNDDLATISAGAIPSEDITEDLLTAESKAVCVQYIEGRLSQNK